jgi:pantetheine-phosphate adenylyltransferase
VKRRAVYPGVFDPPTYGHIDIIRRALQIVDEVVVAVAFNPQKDSALFSPQERVEMFREVLQDEGQRVIVDSFPGLLVDYVEKMGATIVVRGLRAVSDFDYEFQMALMNRHMKPHIETIFLMTSETYFYIASRLVREISSLGGNFDRLVPEAVARQLKKKFSRK